MKDKTRRERTPKGMIDRITRQNGGGGHKDKKSDYQRKPKHRNKDVAGEIEKF